MLAFKVLIALAAVAAPAAAQTYRRTAACPNLGCVFPPDQTDFIAGQVFDIRLEIQAPLNGSEAFNNGVPYTDYTAKIAGLDGNDEPGALVDFTTFFGVAQPAPETYNFTYFEDLFARDAKKPVVVNVYAQSFRHLALYTPGKYMVEFTYNNGQKTIAYWSVLPLSETGRVAKNTILFIGDGMTTAMITAARMLGHKSINGKYQSKLAIDEAPGYGHQMTHSLDSFITDSANSATALYSGKKSTVNALNAYTDSSPNVFSDPKFETTFEMFRRIYNGQIGIVSTAYIADATPAAVCTHTSARSQYTSIIEQFLTGVTGNYSWTQWSGVDVLFGAGAENFKAGPGNGNVSQIDRWASKGYSVALNNTQLKSLDNSKRALGLFCQINLPTWLDRNVYKNSLDSASLPLGGKGTYDLPGLKDMTLKAVEILAARSKVNGTGFMLMSEAASIDKQMHVLDYDRALGELLELDDTVRATIAKLKELGLDEETLVIVTADHGHGFDVFGGADTHYLKAQKTDRKKREAVGVYINSGLSAYTVPNGTLPNNASIVFGAQGANFPVNWEPRYAYAAGMAAGPDHREDYTVDKNAPREPATIPLNGTANDYYVNPEDNVDGFIVNGTIPVSNDQGVHSLQDVPCYAWGPGHELFRGIMNSVDIAFHMATALNLGRSSNITHY